MCKNQNIAFWICAAGEKGWKCFTLVKVCRISLNSLFLLLVLSLCGSKFQFSAASGEVFFYCFLEEQITVTGFQLIFLSISIFQCYLLWYVVSTVPSVEISLLFNSTQSYQLLVQKTVCLILSLLCSCDLFFFYCYFLQGDGGHVHGFSGMTKKEKHTSSAVFIGLLCIYADHSSLASTHHFGETALF